MLTGHQKATIIVNCLFPALAVVATGLRLYVRKLKNLALKADDYTILAALVRQGSFAQNILLITVGIHVRNFYAIYL